MKRFQHRTISTVTAGIIPLSTVGNIQLATYQALCEAAYHDNMSLTIKTYSAYAGVPAPMGSTLMPCHMAEVLADPHFQQSDIIFFPYWGSFPLIDILPFTPKRARKAVLFFGITRPHLYPEQSKDLEEGYRQAIVLNEADMVFVTSDFIAEDVRTFGVASERIHKIPLFPTAPSVAAVPLREPARKKVRLTFLSRFCSAKGVTHLFDALAQWQDRDWSLDVIYHADHSDPVLLDKYRKLSKKLWKGRVCWHPTVDDDEKMCIIEDTDILVMPSLHEGFCVPIIEAMEQGCALVHSDAGSIPENSGGLGLQFPARDVPALVSCLDKAAKARRKGRYACALGELDAEAWRDRAQTHVNFYSYENYKNKLCNALFADLPEKLGNIEELLSRRRVATLNSLGMHTRALPDLPQYMIDAVNTALEPLATSSIPMHGPQTAATGPTSGSQQPHPTVLDSAVSIAPHILHMQQQAQEAEASVQAVYHSLSWKMTAPLRAAALFADAILVALGRKDPLREKACHEWGHMISIASTAADWERILHNRQSQMTTLHNSFSWRVTSPLRMAYELSSKSNILRKIYSKITKKPYIPLH